MRRDALLPDRDIADVEPIGWLLERGAIGAADLVPEVKGAGDLKRAGLHLLIALH